MLGLRVSLIGPGSSDGLIVGVVSLLLISDGRVEISLSCFTFLFEFFSPGRFGIGILLGGFVCSLLLLVVLGSSIHDALSFTGCFSILEVQGNLFSSLLSEFASLVVVSLVSFFVRVPRVHALNGSFEHSEVRLLGRDGSGRISTITVATGHDQTSGVFFARSSNCTSVTKLDSVGDGGKSSGGNEGSHV